MPKIVSSFGSEIAKIEESYPLYKGQITKIGNEFYYKGAKIILPRDFFNPNTKTYADGHDSKGRRHNI